jgi:hypothetical protein
MDGTDTRANPIKSAFAPYNHGRRASRAPLSTAPQGWGGRRHHTPQRCLARFEPMPLRLPATGEYRSGANGSGASFGLPQSHDPQDLLAVPQLCLHPLKFRQDWATTHVAWPAKAVCTDLSQMHPPQFPPQPRVIIPIALFPYCIPDIAAGLSSSPTYTSSASQSA